MALARLGPAAALEDRIAWRLHFDQAGEEHAEASGRRAWGALDMASFSYLGTARFACGGEEHWIVVARHDKTELEFALVPGGEFQMGSPEEEAGRRNDEGPERTQRVTPFLLCRTEVTQEAWMRLMGSNPSHWEGPDLPVEQVSWHDAREWCRRAGLRLPTEAEWEYACRAGTRARFCFGEENADLDEHGWFKGNSRGRTRPVARKRPNAFGLHDMHGNLWEWCEDGYEGAYLEASALPAPGSSPFRVERGGSWGNASERCRSACRGWIAPDYRGRNLGFRPAASLDRRSYT